MLVTENLQHKYSRAQRFTFPDLNCNSSDTLLILGESGVGKTTLLHILGGLLTPNEGSVVINEKSMYNLSSSELDKYRGQNIGVVFQKPHFISSVTAEENLFLAQTMAGLKKDKKRTDELLNALNLYPKRRSRTTHMSQGELQRLSIARAIINEPKVILADEPTSALDDKNCAEVVTLLRTQAQQVGAALVIVTHDNRLKNEFDNQVILN